jgi:phenylalanyl-tRNA synthetase alpha chain
VSKELLAEVGKVKNAALSALDSLSNLEEAKDFKAKFLSDKSEIARISRGLGKLEADWKAKIGKAVTEARSEITDRFAEIHKRLEENFNRQKLQAERVDVTLPVNRTLQGGIHPLSLLNDEIAQIFIAMGYQVVEGPELEAAWLNFDALNIPQDHPARTMQDTFFIEPLESNLVLRTHTSPSQVRTMLTRKPPIYVICPGRTFRSDELDATHTPVFSQVEGLVVDQGISMGHLKGTLDYFAKRAFGEDVITRLRPSFFPFTEPSAEVDVFFNGRWIEWGGCGMVNPNVLKTCGIDTDIYSGFAFGMGLERTLMVRHGIEDIREIIEGDLRFTRSFGLGGR